MVRLQQAVRTFETRQIHDPPAFIRTFGNVVQTGPGPLRFEREDAIEHAHPAPPLGCARGKVAAWSRGGDQCDAICYQLSDCNRHAEIVACCNGIAAAAAVYAQWHQRRFVAMRVDLPGTPHLRVEARVTGPGEVDQTWRSVPFSIRASGRYALCFGPLNDYIVVRADPAAFPVAEAVRLWERFGLAHEPLRARIAVVGLGASPRARFFTCGEREHPSAPLTGLAVLALAAARLGWAPLKSVETPAGPMPLPRVRRRGDGTADVDFPRVVVKLGAESL
jgi:hypothetical protein